MLLARRLTEKGEIGAVLTYLDLVSRSWERTELSPEWKKGLTADEIAGRLEAYSRNGQKLAEWKKLVRRGVVPDDWLWNRDPGAYLEGAPNLFTLTLVSRACQKAGHEAGPPAALRRICGQ